MLCIPGFTESNTSTQGVLKLEIVPLTEAHIIFVPFSWLIGSALYVDDQNIGFKGRHKDKMRIFCYNKEDVFQAEDLCG